MTHSGIIDDSINTVSFILNVYQMMILLDTLVIVLRKLQYTHNGLIVAQVSLFIYLFSFIKIHLLFSDK